LRAHVIVSFVATLVVCSALAQEERIHPDSREWRELFDPPFTEPREIASSSPLRKELFELLRPAIARPAKRPVRFEGSLRALKNWALFIGSTVDEQGASVKFPLVDNSDTWLRTRAGWHLVDYSAGHGDVFYSIWAQQYGTPKELLGVR